MLVHRPPIFVIFPINYKAIQQVRENPILELSGIFFEKDYALLQIIHNLLINFRNFIFLHYFAHVLDLVHVEIHKSRVDIMVECSSCEAEETIQTDAKVVLPEVLQPNTLVCHP